METYLQGENADRWFGQKLSQQQIDRIQGYWKEAVCVQWYVRLYMNSYQQKRQVPLWQRPLWARGLDWYLNDRATILKYETDPWDFGLMGDGLPYRYACDFYDDLYQRLHERWEATQAVEDANATIRTAQTTVTEATDAIAILYARRR